MLFEVLFYLLESNFQDFNNYNYDNHGMNFFKDLKEKFEEEKIAMLSYYIIPYGDENTYKIFMEYFQKFDSYRINKFEKNSDTIANYKDYMDKCYKYLDSIEEYNPTKKTDNGFLFENYDNKDF